jgi:hypothetical protein
MGPVFPAIVLAILVTPVVAHSQTVRPELESRTQGMATNTQVVGPGSWGETVDLLRQRFSDPSRASLPPLTVDQRDALPSPLLWEYAFRRLSAGEADGYYLLNLAKMRMYWDGKQCRDASAAQAFAAISMGFPQLDPKWLPNNDEQRAAVFETLLKEGSIFSATASPWWACSSGMDAIGAAMEHKTLPEGAWRHSPAERKALKAEFEQQLRGLVSETRAKAGG